MRLQGSVRLGELKTRSMAEGRDSGSSSTSASSGSGSGSGSDSGARVVYLCV